ncbi:tetratricopeptide (TPR) repeat protein [Rhizobium azooxidifex]|uniref:Tetratricopeptide (TPR) repeat protein n=1 Tax=Mycoplana azooxidifex TaxID=1636188 RepID=A0A7W6GKW1_9HYPH|nr:tetratricopeptide repeat protein [Mycoplana azooxidifex]MBB3977299.1 tetratricopeptide (TPR) repeat protein [Mycoplana azooxidifex]
MRFKSVFATLLVLAAPFPGALAQTSDTAAVAESVPAETSPAARLDALFDELKHQGDQEKAKAISDNIRLAWRDSGSATVNFLMLQSDKAIAEGKDTAAFDYLDEVIQLAPTYVEGWNQRATLHFKAGNYRKSMSDINRVLALEPRHFGAIAGMAAILTSYGRDERAMEAWQRFLDIYPAERRAQKSLGDLADKLAGSQT